MRSYADTQSGIRSFCKRVTSSEATFRKERNCRERLADAAWAQEELGRLGIGNLLIPSLDDPVRGKRCFSELTQTTDSMSNICRAL